MKKYLMILMVLNAAIAVAQDTNSNSKPRKGFGVAVTQVQPEFPGGDDSLQAFLKRNIVYPMAAKINRLQGRVYIGFKVDRTGKIINPSVLSSASPDLDAEAMRVVKMMPDWKPGTAGGQPIDVQYILPIDFIAPGLMDK
jgi:TonB family protein